MPSAPSADTPQQSTPPPSRSRGDSSPSLSPSTASAARQRSRDPDTAPAAQKKHRPRPANLAGPAPSRQDSASLSREDERTPAFGSGGNGSYLADAKDAKEGERKNGDRPLFAVGGVFPKHAHGSRRGDSSRDVQQGERRGSGPRRRSELGVPRPKHRASSSSQTTASSGSPSAAAEEEYAAYSERGDPFEDLEPSGSKPQVVSHDSETSQGSNRSSGRSRRSSRSREAESEPPETARTRKQKHMGSSETLHEGRDGSEGKGGGGEKSQQHGQVGGPQGDGQKNGRDEDGEGRNWPKDGGEQPGIGGELNQESQQYEDDFAEGENLPIRNYWGTIRYALREPLAEFLGTMALIIIGIGADCQTKVSQNTQGTQASMQWSWGFATMLGIYLAGGVSGGHNNPAITIMLALFRGFPWKMVPRYIIAQIFGAFCGALIIYGNYRLAIKQYDPYKLIKATEYSSNVSATLFVTAPATQVGGTAQGFCQELLASAILSMAVLALGDENNAPPGAGLGAIVLAFVVVAIGMSNGWISGYAINIARDLGPRLALWCIGYGIDLWHHDDWWWLSGAICGPLVGSIAGALAYDLCVFTGPGSPVNYSMRELSEASGFPRMHNMVRMVVHPSYRRRRLAAVRTQNPEDLAESGMAPTALGQARSTTPRSGRPGKATKEQEDEVAFKRRFRVGREKVEREEHAVRKKQEKEQQEWRKSIEQMREKEAGKGEPVDDSGEREAREGVRDKAATVKAAVSAKA
ncbi:hypothetical protein JCM10213_000284 [Rhodosporidiobolus nylandii]